jgi:hypothetical protein
MNVLDLFIQILKSENNCAINFFVILKKEGKGWLLLGCGPLVFIRESL